MSQQPEATNNSSETRDFKAVLSDISELARAFLDERKIYGDMRVDIKKRMARARMFIVNNLPEFLTDPEVIKQLKIAEEKKTKLTTDTVDALVAMELGEDFYRYETAKFKSDTSERAFPMFQAELSGYQSQIKKDAAELSAQELVERMEGGDGQRKVWSKRNQ
jgi:hypothetical protein